MSEPPTGPSSADSSSPDPTQRMRARLGAVLALASARLPTSAPDLRSPTGPAPSAPAPTGPAREGSVAEAPRAGAAPPPGGRPPDGAGTVPLLTAAVGASIRVRASEPNDLGVTQRTELAKLFQRVGAWALGLSAAGMFLAALAAFRWIGGENVDVGAVGWAAVGLALVALTSLVLAYFTVMGFRQIEYEADLGGGEHEVGQRGSNHDDQGRSDPDLAREQSGDGRRAVGS